MTSLKAIIFASNVFSNSDKSYDCFAKEFDLSKADLVRLNKKYFLPAKKGRYNKKQLVEKLAQELKTTKKHVFENAKDCGSLLKIDKKVINYIKELRKNYKIVAVSNTNELFASLPKEKNLYKMFDLAVLSYKIKSLRPELKTYKEILRKLKVEGSECLYIDSKEKMLVPAKKLGMKVMLYKNFERLKKELVNDI